MTHLIAFIYANLATLTHHVHFLTLHDFLTGNIGPW